MKFRITLFIFLFLYESLAFAQARYNAFTVHENGEPTVFYLMDISGNKYPRFIICPDRQEGNAGTSVEVRHSNEYKNLLWVSLGEDSAYCEKGDVYVAIMDYNNITFPLYQQPNEQSIYTKITYKHQIARIYDECKEWLYIKVVDDAGAEIFGWIPPYLIENNPYLS